VDFAEIGIKGVPGLGETAGSQIKDQLLRYVNKIES
jgi:hypothetical protein